MDRRYATVKIYTLVAEALSGAIQKAAAPAEPQQPAPLHTPTDAELQESTLSKVDLSLSMDKEEYKKKLKKLQERIHELHGRLYRKRIRWCLALRDGTPEAKGAPSNV